MLENFTNSHTEPRRNPPYGAALRPENVQVLLDLLDRYGWGYDLDLVERMGDAHWEVITGLARITTGQNISLPSEQTRKLVIERIRTRLQRALA